MARYINADILAKIVFDKWQECDELKHIIPAIRNAIMCASTADVVEVVRCKDCKHSTEELVKLYCNLHDMNVDNVYFCADGERREDE